jgi:hypothetical protein
MAADGWLVAGMLAEVPRAGHCVTLCIGPQSTTDPVEFQPIFRVQTPRLLDSRHFSDWY